MRVAADQPRAAARRASACGRRERHGGLRPDHEARARAARPLASSSRWRSTLLQAFSGSHFSSWRMPPWTRPTRIRPVSGPGRAQEPGAAPPTPAPGAPRGRASAARRVARADAARYARSAERRDQQERHAVDRRDRRDLDDRQVRLLAVAEQAPGELEEGVRRAAARSPPTANGAPSRPRVPKRGHQAADRPAEERAGRARRRGTAQRHDHDAPRGGPGRRTGRPRVPSSRAGPAAETAPVT